MNFDISSNACNIRPIFHQVFYFTHVGVPYVGLFWLSTIFVLFTLIYRLMQLATAYGDLTKN